ncbi:MAG: hypothetical protein KBB86_02295 [Candidatus Pacebacteria bacterium]|nr:hypothetical protein [Candidatus Paceibacterota bacterium]
MRKLLKVSSVLATTAGVIMVAGGVWGIMFTHNTVAREKIITPEDAEIAGQPVRGPLTLMAQANVIRDHTLKTTGGKTYAEMPRQIAKLDTDGKPVFDASGNAVMVPNGARDMWITATALTTALNLGIVTYAFSGLMVLLGLISIWTGITFNALSKKVIAN